MYISEVLCALAVALLCAEVEANVRKVIELHGTVKDLDTVLFNVQCGGVNCKILDIKFDGIKANKDGTYPASLYAYSGDGLYDICYTSAPATGCSGKTTNLQQTQFFIELEPDPEFTGGILTVEIGNGELTLTELNVEGASVQIDPISKKNMVRIKSGAGEISFPDILPQYEVQCFGHCKNLEFNANSHEHVKLALAEGEPVLPKTGGCHNCMCTSHEEQRNLKICKGYQGRTKYSLFSNNAYVTLVPDNKLRDVVAYLRGDNILSISRYDPSSYWDRYTKNGLSVLVHPIKDQITARTTIKLLISCEQGKTCKSVKIEVVTQSTVYNVRAGKQIGTSNLLASCLGRKQCQRSFNPALEYSYGDYQFRVIVDLGKSAQYYSAYVRISGVNLGQIW